VYKLCGCVNPLNDRRWEPQGLRGREDSGRENRWLAGTLSDGGQRWVVSCGVLSNCERARPL